MEKYKITIGRKTNDLKKKVKNQMVYTLRENIIKRKITNTDGYKNILDTYQVCHAPP